MTYNSPYIVGKKPSYSVVWSTDNSSTIYQLITYYKIDTLANTEILKNNLKGKNKK